MKEEILQNKPEISIGMPVYNGEKFLKKRLESLLNQTFKNFELIISDNCSTDNTREICKDFASRDNRIQYFRQDENRGVTWNLNFVLKKAEGEFFLWAAVDDMILPEFLEKNYQVLKNNKNCVASISNIEPITDIEKDEEFFSKVKTNLRDATRPRTVFTLRGTFGKKARAYLRKSSCQVIYSLFRRKELCTYYHEPFIGNDWAVFLNILKYGDLLVLDDVLMYEYQSGITGKGISTAMSYYNNNWFTRAFPWYPLTRWCFKSLGRNIFLKNLDYFIQLNLEGLVSLLIDRLNKWKTKGE